ncbi:MAG: [protein-PII] uridylyltransferase family protein, partial [Planctomycetota bacterium]
MPGDDGRQLPLFVTDAAALAEWLEARREDCIDTSRADVRAGAQAARELSDCVDDAVAAAARETLPGGASWGVVALGEWAGGELAPGSVPELLIVGSPASGEFGAAAGKLIELLRSAGLAAGGEVRDLEELRAAEAGEAAALAGARAVAGDERVLSAVGETAAAALESRGRKLVEERVLRLLERHREEGGSVCRLEPDLLRNPGGLADCRAVRWIERVLGAAGLADRLAGRGLLEEEDFEDLAAVASFLTGCRAVAHGLAGGPVDRLDRDGQARLAAALSYRSGEDADAAGLLMRDVFRAMRTAYRVVKVVVAQHEEERAWRSRRKTVERRKPLGRDFIRIGKRIYLSRPDLFEGRGAGLRMMDGFHRAAGARLGFSREFLKRVTDSLYAVGDEVRESADAAKAFREILASPGGAAAVLRAMHESGFLGAYLPEFGEIDCLVTGEPDQEYTVDEHTLMTVEVLDLLEGSVPPGLERAASLAPGLPMDLVRLAALVHAVGKSRGAAGFASRSAVMVPRIARQLRLDEREARLLVFLTENQNLLEDVAGSRMTTDQQLLGEMAEGIGEALALDALYVLSCADLSTLKPGAAPALRAEQLAALHSRLSARLAARPARGRGRLAEETAEVLPEGLGSEDLARHLEQVPERYLLEVSPADCALHLGLLGEMKDGEAVAVEWSRRKGHVHVWVLGPDRPRRISQIAWACLRAGAWIVSARAYTRTDGIIIDQFDLVPAGDSADEGPDEFWNAAAGTIREVLTAGDQGPGIGDLAAPGPGSPVPDPRVSFDNKISADYTVVDVQCPDRLGVLYAMSA